MNFLKNPKQYWKTYLVLIEIVLLIYFSYNIVSDGSISGTNFILSLVFTSAIFNTFFFIIFSIYDQGTFSFLNRIGKLLAITNFIYCAFVFSNILSVSSNWIVTLMSSIFVGGLALQYYIGLGNLEKIRWTWLFRINSFLIILLSFYGIFLFLLKAEDGAYYNFFYLGMVIVFILSLASNLFNFQSVKLNKENQSI